MSTNAKSIDWQAEYERRGGDPEVIFRFRTRHGDTIPLDHIGRDVVDYARNKNVSNITGLLVTRVTKAVTRATHGMPRTAAEQRQMLERQASFAVFMYQAIAEQGLKPNQIADMLDQAAAKGILISTLTVDRLREMGTRWPGRT